MNALDRYRRERWRDVPHRPGVIARSACPLWAEVSDRREWDPAGNPTRPRPWAWEIGGYGATMTGCERTPHAAMCVASRRLREIVESMTRGDA